MRVIGSGHVSRRGSGERASTSHPGPVASVGVVVLAIACGARPPTPNVAVCGTPGRWRVTSGRLQRGSALSHLVLSPTIRATLRGADGRAGGVLNFRYLGPTSSTRPFASGRVREQVAVAFLRRDTCNVVYAAWTLAGSDVGVRVLRKRNPDQTTHGGCGNRGYEAVEPDIVSRPPLVALGDMHVLEVRLAPSDVHGYRRLALKADHKLVWSGRLRSEPTDGHGLGIRLDNVAAELCLSSFDKQGARRARPLQAIADVDSCALASNVSHEP